MAAIYLLEIALPLVVGLCEVLQYSSDEAKMKNQTQSMDKSGTDSGRIFLNKIRAKKKKAFGNA